MRQDEKEFWDEIVRGMLYQEHRFTDAKGIADWADELLKRRRDQERR